MTPIRKMRKLVKDGAAMGKSQADIARDLGVSPQRFHDVITGRRPCSGRLLDALGYKAVTTVKYVEVASQANI